MSDARSKIIKILKKIPLFLGLHDDEYFTLSSLFVAKEFAADRYIFREGDTSMCMYVLLSGEVDLITHDKGEIYTLKPGENFGEIGLISQNPRSATAKTTKPTALMEITREDYNILMSKYPHISNVVVRNIAVCLANHVIRMNTDETTEHIPNKKSNRDFDPFAPKKKRKKKPEPTVIKRAG